MYELSTLPNGLRLLTVPIPHVQSASLGFFVGVGSRYESKALSGISHFIEHMVFKGTTHRPSPLAIAEAIEGKGGVLNASTGLETTLYWAKVAANRMTEALDLLSDLLLNAILDPADIDRERDVINEEINYGLDAPDCLVQLLVSQLQWPDHPLGRDVAGSRESLAELGRPALAAYLADHYRPERIVLGAAGRIEHQDILSWAQSNLGDWEPGRSFSFEPAPPDHHGPSLRTEFRDIEQSHLSFSFTGLARRDPDRHVLRILNVILGEGMQSRLFQEVRERLGLAYAVDSYVSLLQDTGAVGVDAGVAADHVEEAIRAILSQLDRLRQEPVAEEELEKAREFLKGRLLLSLEDSFTVGTWYARQELLGPEVLTPEEALARFDSVQPSDLQRLAQTLFRTDRLNLAIVGPYAQDGDRLRQLVQF